MHEQHGQPKRRRVLPPDIAGANLKLWLRSDLGVTLVADPVIGAWTLAAGWTAAGGGVYSHAGAADNLSQAILVVGNAYRVTYTVSGVSGGTIRPYAGTTAGTSRAADGTYTEVLVCAGNTSMIFVGNGTASVGAISIESLSVSAWADQSGNGHDVVQATATKQPTYYSSGGPSDLPYVLFDGVADTLAVADHSDFDVGNGSWFVLTALRWISGGASYRCHIAKASHAVGNGFRLFHSNTSRMAAHWGTDVQPYPLPLAPLVSDGPDFLYGAGHDSISSQVVYRLNGVEVRMAAASAGTGSNAEPLVLGASSDGTGYITNFRMYEVAIWKLGAVAVPSADLAILDSWLGARYSL